MDNSSIIELVDGERKPCRDERLVVAWGRTTERRESSHGDVEPGSKARKFNFNGAIIQQDRTGSSKAVNPCASRGSPANFIYKRDSYYVEQDKANSRK